MTMKIYNANSTFQSSDLGEAGRGSISGCSWFAITYPLENRMPPLYPAEVCAQHLESVNSACWNLGKINHSARSKSPWALHPDYSIRHYSRTVGFDSLSTRKMRFAQHHIPLAPNVATDTCTWRKCRWEMQHGIDTHSLPETGGWFFIGVVTVLHITAWYRTF